MSAGRPVLVLLSRPGCHLCQDLREVLERVLPDFGATLEERDVRADVETSRLYALEVPVLLLDGREVLRHRATEAELRARLSALLAR
ncbi:MAG TPA: glutaredoxin family protein [Vicinamibacteria bacterium]|nr:glutaredoxin family protein [Vicinamibacteria bacterium]